MKKNYLILLVISLLSSTGFAQVSWEKLFSKQSTDVFRCVEEVGTNGYILAGYTADSSVNDTDGYVVRLNPNGDTIWTYTFNGIHSGKDLFYKIINTSDGGFFACGYSTSGGTGGSDDYLFVKWNSSGQVQWDVIYGGPGKERAQDVVETIDGYTIAGYTTSAPAQYYDATILHIDFSGAIVWEKSYGGIGYDDANSIKQLPDGGYITGGQSESAGVYLQFLIRAKSNGDTMWTKRLPSAGNANIESLTLTSDGFVLAGSINTQNTDNGYMVKTDTSGNVLWNKIFGGADQDDFHRVEKTADGGFILSGTTASSGPLNPNMWLFKTDANGDSSWAYKFGGDNHDHGYSGMQTSDGGYIIAGHSGSFGFNNEDGYVVKLGPNGTGTNHLTYIAAYSLASPLCASGNSQVKVVLRNFGNEPVSNIPVTVEVTGGINQTFNTTYPGPLAPHDVVTVTFTPTFSTNGVGALTFHGFATVSNDVYPANNSFLTTLTLSPCVGIEDVHRELAISVYPNPANEKLVIGFLQNYRKAKIELINCIGETVNSFNLENTSGVKKVIDLSSFSKGLYLVKVSTEEGIDTRKVLVE